jgi:hypothetical protein
VDSIGFGGAEGADALALALALASTLGSALALTPALAPARKPAPAPARALDVVGVPFEAAPQAASVVAVTKSAPA